MDKEDKIDVLYKVVRANICASGHLFKVMECIELGIPEDEYLQETIDMYKTCSELNNLLETLKPA